MPLSPPIALPHPASFSTATQAPFERAREAMAPQPAGSRQSGIRPAHLFAAGAMALLMVQGETCGEGGGRSEVLAELEAALWGGGAAGLADGKDWKR